MKKYTESSFSRIIQHIENGVSFAVISAYRSEFKPEENKQRHLQLGKDIQKMGYGFIMQDSGYQYQDGTVANEQSYFVPTITYKEAIDLGNRYDQESILYKDDQKGFILVYSTNFIDSEGVPHHINDIAMTFKWKSSDGKITFDSEVLKYAFSSLKRANSSQKGKKYAFIGECVSLDEAIPPSRHEAVMKKNDYHWVKLLEATHDSEIKKMNILNILNDFNEVGKFDEDELPVHFFPTKYGSMSEASQAEAFWARLGSNGIEVYDVSQGTHIGKILDNPELFGLTREQVEETYAKYGERIGLEGKAREEIIKHVAQEGWVRIRHYTGRNDYWSIQADDTEKRKKEIKAFCYWALKIPRNAAGEKTGKPIMSYHDSVIIMGYDSHDDIKRYEYQNGGVKHFMTGK